MNVTSTLWCFRIAFFFGCACLFRSSDCFTVSADYKPDGVEFTCVISPYQGNQKWYIDSALVAGCGAANCLEVTTNPSQYSFKPNTSTGIFIFKIDPINSTDEGSIVKCNNGTDNTTLTIAFPVKSSPTENPCYCWCWFDKLCWCIFIIIIFCIVGGLTLLSYIAALVIYCKQNLSNKLLKDLNYKNWRLFIPFFGLYLIIIYCKSDKVNPGTQQHLIYDKNSVTNNSFNMRGRPAASNGEREKKCAEVKEVKSDVAKPLPVTTLDGMLTTCRRKHQRIAGEDEICCDNCKETRKSHASHAYCLSDKEYICTSCLNKCHKQCVLLWNTGNVASKDHKLCYIEHYKMEDLKLEGVCQECKRFICSKCMKKHEGHICTRHQQLHETFSDGARITPNLQGLSNEMKTCSGCRSQPIECLNVHSNIIVCADCFEKGKQPAKGRLNVNDIKDILREGQKPCQIHGVLGKGRPLPVEAFCFVCNMYMCVECFKKHRRIYDYWSKNLEGNMFYCSYCKGDEMLPVVCFDLLSRGFKCAKCFQFKRQTSETNSLPAEVSKAICEITDSADPFLCHEDLSTDGRMSCTAEVYCLVCKVIMCRNCFNRHQQEK